MAGVSSEGRLSLLSVLLFFSRFLFIFIYFICMICLFTGSCVHVCLSISMSMSVLVYLSVCARVYLSVLFVCLGTCDGLRACVYVCMLVLA